MADAIYHFTWGTFCDWYVELVKGAFDDETRAVAAWAFDQILVMLHPFMPFVTEELWHTMGERPYELIVAKWPEPEAQRDPRCGARNRRAGRGDRPGPRHARRAQHSVERRSGARMSSAAMLLSLERLDKNAATLSRMAKVGAASCSRCSAAGLGADRRRRRDDRLPA